MEIAALLCLIGALGLLLTLTIIDLRTWLLPDPLNLALGLLGISFHALFHFTLLSPFEILAGGVLGAGMLLTVRYFGNRHYKQDTLGLGDVKLLGAAGLWLGPEGVVIAMTMGAFAGLMHGIAVGLARAFKTKSKPDFHRLMIPAGPGFCIGIAATLFWQRHNEILFLITKVFG
jgi:leader peptidase (prepilin peptidase)/N-methyltransferase